MKRSLEVLQPTSILTNMINMSASNWLSFADALALLGVRPQTLYANISRKRIRARPDPHDPRRSQYHGGDVRRLAARRSGRPSHERIAAESVSWGTPVLPSAISTVVRGRLWYRGMDAIELAGRANLEDVAALLWQTRPIRVGGDPRRKSRRSTSQDALEAACTRLAARAVRDRPIHDRVLSSLQEDALDLFADLSDVMVGAIEQASAKRGRSIRGRQPVCPSMMHMHERLAGAWRRPEAVDIIRRALVLLADHELNASTFAARVAASTGAALSACVLAGFATLSGPRHGTAGIALRKLVEAAARGGAEDAIRDSLAHGRVIPAFGHPLYLDGDVRAFALLERMHVPRAFEDLPINAERLIGERPNVDFALSALAASTGLPREAPFVLFALSRSVGWIAHALEQSQSPGLIRPRARYVGPPVSAA